MSPMQTIVASERVTSPTATRTGVVLDSGADRIGPRRNKPRYQAAVESSDGAWYIPTSSQTTQHTAWGYAYKISRDQHARERRDQEKVLQAEAKKRNAARKAEIQAQAGKVSDDLSAAYAIGKDRKFTDDDIDAELMAAAIAALRSAESEGQISWSEFLVDMLAKVENGETLSKGMYRGILNALRRYIVRTQEAKVQMSAYVRLAAKLERVRG